MQTVANYRRRIIARLESWKCRTLLLAQSEPTVQCAARLQFAGELLSYHSHPQDLDIEACML